MRRRTHLLLIVLLAAPLLPVSACAGDDDYAAMLRYLTQSTIDGRAAQDATGAIAVNQAAGDLNAQANLCAIAVGDHAHASIDASALRTHDAVTAPDVATARIGGQAFSRANGLISINQASGGGNAELNAVALTLARHGIREASDAQLLAGAPASNGGQAPITDTDARRRVRSAVVESTAMKGTSGVLQLNQIAGSGNATANVLTLGVSSPP
jgi:hypothetical protein